MLAKYLNCFNLFFSWVLIIKTPKLHKFRRIKVLISLILFSISNHSNSQVSFCAVGDILFDRGVKTTIDSNSVNYLFEEVKGIISKTDIAFFNLECPLANIEDGFPLLKKH